MTDDGMDSLRLDDRVAIVTGAAAGIGTATAEILARRGAKVLLVDINIAAAQAEAVRIGRGALAFEANVGEPAEHVAAVDFALEKWGRLDIGVNNAGSGNVQALTADYPIENWQHTLNIYLSGVFYGMRAQIPAMLSTGGGSIVNTTSIMGLIGYSRSPAYAAAKHGVIGLTRTAALDYATANIRVNAVAPGFVDTPRVRATASTMSEAETAALLAKQPLGRLGNASEIADLIAFLASDASSFSTGAVYAADGGYTAQ